MARMVRKQLNITAEQDRRLAQRAELFGVSQAQLVRTAIDRLLDGDQQTARERAAADMLAFFKELDARAGPVPQTPRTWTREDAHDRS